MKQEGSLRICGAGHRYYKSSDCPTCPLCEMLRKPEAGFLSLLVAPARRALENEGIRTLAQLARRKESEISRLHGMGPTSVVKLRKSLEVKGLSFRKE